MATSSKKRQFPDNDDDLLSNPASLKKRKLNKTDEKDEDENENELKWADPDLPLGIIFLTGNKGKLKEVQKYLGDDIKKYMINYKVDLPEIQGNEEEILSNKLNKAKEIIQTKLNTNKNNENNKKELYILVEDTSLYLSQYSKKGFKFPGPFCKFLLKANGCQGYIDMVKHHKDRSCTALCMFGLLKISFEGDSEKPLFFRGECKGNITDGIRGNAGFGWDPVFEFIGNKKTFGEMSTEEKNKISHRANALKQLKEYLQKNIISKNTD